MRIDSASVLADQMISFLALYGAEDAATRGRVQSMIHAALGYTEEEERMEVPLTALLAVLEAEAVDGDRWMAAQRKAEAR